MAKKFSLPIFMRVGVGSKEVHVGNFETEKTTLDPHELAEVVREIADVIEAGKFDENDISEEAKS